MKKKGYFFKAAVAVLSLMIIAAFLGADVRESTGKMFGTSEQLVNSIEKIFELNDQWAMDAEPFPVWGPYWCAHLTKGKGTMIHFAKDPSKDDADIVLLVQAEQLIESAGLTPEAFPQLTEPPFGPGLESGQWYYVPKFKLLLLPMSAEEVGMKNNLVPRVN